MISITQISLSPIATLLSEEQLISNPLSKIGKLLKYKRGEK